MSSSGLDEIGRLLIIGMARSGIATALAARRMLPDVEVILSDNETEPKAAAEAEPLQAAGVRVELGREDNALLDGCGLVVKSPGVPQESSLLLEAHMRGIPVWGEVEFAWRFLPNILVGVTGTNGKTTTTELLGHIIGASGRPCRVAGNVGVALSSLVGEVDEDEVLVVELSSFQLEDNINFRPDIAILLNLAEDHLDRHADLESYFAAKMRIFENQQPEDISIINLDDGNCRRPVPGHASRVWFSRSAGDARPDAGESGEPLVFKRMGVIRAGLHGLDIASAGLRSRLPLEYSGRIDTAGGEVRNEGASTLILDWQESALRGDHNLDNCLAAAAACLCLGLSPEEVAAGIKSFPGVPHRLQEVGVVDGVTYVNDSKATNVDAALKALTAYQRGIHLILGGRTKGCDFDNLAEAASDPKVSEVILIGEAAPTIAASFDLLGGEVLMADDLEAAVRTARESAEPGDTVLLSPACASFDQYENYEQRGAHFVNLVKQMMAEAE
ncbi:MAG: UDP-N-acetylmuramoyl-L-alanine--D-glutamate ligase [Thermoleophilia bacterium]|nr:UDP-N-acetylmuramoyl-L-alanine--D-glutamate ligase [Thermoleophilia bacterium]